MQYIHDQLRSIREFRKQLFLLAGQAEEGPEKKVSAFFKILPVDHLFR
jgi:hypothetical protein